MSRLRCRICEFRARVLLKLRANVSPPSFWLKESRSPSTVSALQDNPIHIVRTKRTESDMFRLPRQKTSPYEIGEAMATPGHSRGAEGRGTVQSITVRM